MFRNRILLAGGLGLMLGLSVCGAFQAYSNAAAEDKAELAIAHNVYFALKDSSADSKAKLVAEIKKYLSKPEGSIAFAAGTRDEEIKSQVNDKDYDVALLLVFKDKASFDKYAASEPHKKFVADNLSGWKGVRVFDSRVSH
jgi:Stress responsive A/B Barrel Domain